MYAFPCLPRIIGSEMFARLLAMMPPPLDPSPEAARDRDIVAMCMLKQMGPLKSSEEASLAITIVAADAHAHDALRGAVENAGDLKVVMQCRAQANAMMRTRHKAAAELEALMRSRIAAERLQEVEEPEQPVAEVETVAAAEAPPPDPAPRPEVPANPPAPVVRRAMVTVPVTNETGALLGCGCPDRRSPGHMRTQQGWRRPCNGCDRSQSLSTGRERVVPENWINPAQDIFETNRRIGPTIHR